MIYGLLEGLRKDGRPCAKNCLIAAENDLKAKELYEDYRLYDRDVYLYPAKDLIFFQGRYSRQSADQRADEGFGGSFAKKRSDGYYQHGRLYGLSAAAFRPEEHTLHFGADSPLDMENLKKKLLGMGYERCAQAEAPGQFCFRGGIIDIFPLTEDKSRAY